MRLSLKATTFILNRGRVVFGAKPQVAGTVEALLVGSQNNSSSIINHQFDQFISSSYETHATYVKRVTCESHMLLCRSHKTFLLPPTSRLPTFSPSPRAHRTEDAKSLSLVVSHIDAHTVAGTVEPKTDVTCGESPPAKRSTTKTKASAPPTRR